MQIIIPTYRRLHAQKTLATIPRKLRTNVALAVRREEARAAESLGVDVWVLPSRTTTISATRAAVGRLADERGHAAFFMLDDDLKLFQRVDGKLTPMNEKSWIALFRRLDKILREVPSASVSARFGNGFVKEDTRYLGRQTQATAYNTAVYNSLKFGGSNYFEDAERTLQLFSRGHRNAVLYDYAIEAGRMNTPGGCSTFRHLDGMRADALGMAARWPGIVTYKEKPDPTFFSCGSARPDINVAWKKAFRP